MKAAERRYSAQSSLNPLTVMVALVNMMVGEVIFGGVDAQFNGRVVQPRAIQMQRKIMLAGHTTGGHVHRKPLPGRQSDHRPD